MKNNIFHTILSMDGFVQLILSKDLSSKAFSNTDSFFMCTFLAFIELLDNINSL